VHGTDEDIAWKIASSGFAALSSLDNGWFGRGIYFTSSALYALPYYSSKPKPCVIISFLIPGNPFPVTEHRSNKDSLEGQAISPGYQSNYVHTTKSGEPCDKKYENDFYDEIVIEQESQVVPAFLVSLTPASIKNVAERFTRDIATPDSSRQIKIAL